MRVNRITSMAVAVGLGFATVSNSGVAAAAPTSEASSEETTTRPSEATESTSSPTTAQSSPTTPATTAPVPTTTSEVESTTPAPASAETSPATAAADAPATPTIPPTATSQQAPPIVTPETATSPLSTTTTMPPSTTTPATTSAPPSVAAAPTPPTTVTSAPTTTTVAQAAPQRAAARVASTPVVSPQPTVIPDNPIAALVTIPATIIAVVPKLLAAVVASFAAPIPGAPAPTPLPWVLLAIVRREFLNGRPDIRPTVSAPDASGLITISLPKTDDDGDELVYTASVGSKGTVVRNADGHSFTYTPNPGQTGTDSVRITANDATTPHIHGLSGLLYALSFGRLGDSGHTSTADVTVALNTPPAVTVSAGRPDTTTGAVTVSVVATDADGDTLTITPSGGKSGTTFSTPVIVDETTGTYQFTYTPAGRVRHAASAEDAAGEALLDGIRVTVNDGHGGTVIRPVGVAVSPSNTAPQAISTKDVAVDATTGVVTGTIVATDADGDTLVFGGSGPTGRGSVVVNSDGSFVYTPSQNDRYGAAITPEDDVDTVTVTIRDGHGAIVSADLSVTVAPLTVSGDPAAAEKGSKAAFLAAAQERTMAQTELRASLDQLAPNMSSIDTEILLVQVAVALRDAETAGDTSAVKDQQKRKEQLRERLALSEIEYDRLDTLALRVDSADRRIQYTIGSYFNALAATIAPSLQTAGAINYRPVLSRIVTTTDLDTGVVRGKITFVDRDGEALTYWAGVVRAPGFDAQPIALNTSTGEFTFTPISGTRPKTLQIDVRATDPRGGTSFASATIDYTARTNLVSGPGASGSSIDGKTTTTSFSRTQTDAELIAAKEAAIDDAVERITTLQGDLGSAMASIETFIEEERARSAARLSQATP